MRLVPMFEQELVKHRNELARGRVASEAYLKNDVSCFDMKVCETEDDRGGSRLSFGPTAER